VEQEQKWNNPGVCGTPPGITIKGQSGTMERAVVVVVPGLVPPKMSHKNSQNPIFIYNTYIITYLFIYSGTNGTSGTKNTINI
jgi:hypothetical protein